MMFRKVPFAVLLGLGAFAFAIAGMVSAALASDAQGSMVVVQDPSPSGSTPSIPQYQVVTPNPGGSVVVVTQPPSGSGPSAPQYQVVVPGPNPAQNSGVGVGQQLSTPGNNVTVYPGPGE